MVSLPKVSFFAPPRYGAVTPARLPTPTAKYAERVGPARAARSGDPGAQPAIWYRHTQRGCGAWAGRYGRPPPAPRQQSLPTPKVFLLPGPGALRSCAHQPWLLQPYVARSRPAF